MDQMDVKKIKERERNFREKDAPFGEFTVRTKTKWWSEIELSNVYSNLDPSPNDKILDVGCSDGRFLEYINRKNSHCFLVGTDFACNPLKELNTKNFRSYPICVDAASTPFKEKVFDKVASIQVIQQVPSRAERIKVLKNIYRLLKSKGVFVLTVLNQESWKDMVENGKEGPLKSAKDLFVYLYNEEDLKSELIEAGFHVNRIQAINSLPVRYLKRLGILSVFFDRLLTRCFKGLSFQKGTYLLAQCIKK